MFSMFHKSVCSSPVGINREQTVDTFNLINIDLGQLKLNG